MKVMVIGGASGIGRALALHYLAQGAQLAVCSRRLAGPGCDWLTLHPQVRGYGFDIADRAALTDAIRHFGIGGLDVLIVTAGQYADAATLAAQPDAGIGIVQTNVLGLAQAFDTAATLMREQGHGQLVAVASIAGLLEEYPGGSLYSASKRAAIGICDAYRKALLPFGIAVTTIVPGYVDTARLRELNGGDAGSKLFLQSEAAAVRRMVGAIGRREAHFIFPWQLQLMARLFNLLPAGLQRLRRK
ncbi:SDR family NAD(P)-dependent oxidoreductase [Massilia sp. MS-15]|uniref:SDR family NAD(P)-dependent oxidoreductase n=1 Tax=Massilia sp. MS-15 TaxID=2878200 RepID=UPI001CD78817|nr:SDR family NAD(P)-dependent oxidoreductase [Massilia sp. MS-15]MCA1248872.1 SDR family NAD(P)-dependent oxidoreductase [Massilia sp. MS-15]